MHTTNTIEIHGDPERVTARAYKLAAEIAHWPDLLPHYRYMTIREQSDTHKIADFGAVRFFSLFPSRLADDTRHPTPDTLSCTPPRPAITFPVKWQARQDLFPESLRITYQHLHGISRGMQVAWRLTPNPAGVHIEITHELTYPFPLGAWFAAQIVGKVFVHPIAGRTLQCLKEQIESEEAQH